MEDIRIEVRDTWKSFICIIQEPLATPAKYGIKVPEIKKLNLNSPQYVVNVIYTIYNSENTVLRREIIYI